MRPGWLIVARDGTVMHSLWTFTMMSYDRNEEVGLPIQLRCNLAAVEKKRPWGYGVLGGKCDLYF